MTDGEIYALAIKMAQRLGKDPDKEILVDINHHTVKSIPFEAFGLRRKEKVAGIGFYWMPNWVSYWKTAEEHLAAYEAMTELGYLWPVDN